jgi:selenide,water dikinase
LASDLRLIIDTTNLPQLPDAEALCGAGFTCGGTDANASYTQGRVVCSPGLKKGMIGLVHDPQTSGGLLVAIPATRCDELIAVVTESGTLCAVIIGEVCARGTDDPYLEFR